jgi:AcrR family transcriptional regulator
MTPELDPRIERSRRVIAEAALEEMADVGYGAMTVEGIAKRAGVSKATIYRHWAGKLEIVESALEMVKATMTFDEAAPPRERLTQLLRSLADYVGDDANVGAACLPSMVSAARHYPAVRDFLHRFSASRRKVLIDMVIEGQAVGDIDSSLEPELAAELLVGPIFYRRLMTGSSFPAADIDRVVDAVLGPAS